MTDNSETISPASVDENFWEEAVEQMLRAEMVRKGVSYAALVRRLSLLGIADTEANLRNKVSRGRFSAVFLIQCLRALEVEWLQVSAVLNGALDQEDAQGPVERMRGFSGSERGKC